MKAPRVGSYIKRQADEGEGLPDTMYFLHVCEVRKDVWKGECMGVHPTYIVVSKFKKDGQWFPCTYKRTTKREWDFWYSQCTHIE